MRSVLSGPVSAPPPEAPPAARGTLHLPWEERFAGASVDASRNFAVACVFALAFLLCVVALGVVAAGRSVQPYVLRATAEGAILPAGDRLVPYRPGDAERRYFLGQWSRHLLAMDAQLSEAWLAEAYQQTRGKATVEFTDWLHASSPLKKLKDDPNLTRAATISSISLVGDGLALIRVACERRSLDHPDAVREKFLLTVHFSAVPPVSEAAILQNPIGLAIEDFQVAEDLEK